MSDVMLLGVLKMPYEMAMESELSRLQFYQRVQQLVARVEAQPAQEPVACLDCGSHNVGIPATYDSLINSVKAPNI